MDLARAHAPQVSIATAQRDVYAAQLGDVKRNWFPTGELTYFLTAAPNVECEGPVGADGKGIGGIDPLNPTYRTQNCVNTIDPSSKSNVSYFSTNFGGLGMQLEARLAQPIFTFGKIEYGWRAADHGVRAGDHGIEAARREVELLAVRAYWSLKTARAGLALARDARERIGPWDKKISDDLDAEKPHFQQRDLAKLRIALDDLDEQVANLERLEVHAHEGLKTLVGEDLDVDEAELEVVEAVERPLDYYETAAELGRPELRQIDEGVAALEDVARVRRSEMLPNLALVANLTFRYAPSIEDSSSAFVNHANVFGYGAALALSQPLDLVQKLGKLHHASADAQMLAAQRRGLRDSIRYDITRAFADLREARTRLSRTEAAQRTAQGWFKTASDDMDSLDSSDPSGDARNLVDAARAYFDQRGKYLQAILDVNVAVASLRRASGVDVAR